MSYFMGQKLVEKNLIEYSLGLSIFTSVEAQLLDMFAKLCEFNCFDVFYIILLFMFGIEP